MTAVADVADAADAADDLHWNKFGMCGNIVSSTGVCINNMLTAIILV